MRPHLAIPILISAACLAGCGSGSSSGQPDLRQTTTATSATTTTTTTAVQATMATIAGRFRIVGGPYPGINRPLSGTITIHAGAASGPIVAQTRAIAGRFNATLKPGRYSFVGKTGDINGMSCATYKPTTTRDGQTSHVTVQCDVP